MGNNFEDLEVWKRACRLAVEIYKVLKTCNDLGFRDQMQRAAISVASNIAEGSERNSVTEFNRFLNIAKGSVAKLRTQLYIAAKVGILSPENSAPFVAESKEISKMIQGLCSLLK